MNKKDFEIVVTLAKIGLVTQVATPPRKRDADLKPWDSQRFTDTIDNDAQFVIDHNRFEIEETD